MAFPSGWTPEKLIIDFTQVGGSTITDAIIPISLDSVPSTLMDASGTSFQNGGGDIRVTTDLAGLTQIPLYVHECVTSATEASRKLTLVVEVPSVSGTVDTDIYIWAGGGGSEVQPAVTDTYGRNAVFATREAFWCGINDTAPVDLTGNSTMSHFGTFTANDDGLAFDGSTNWMSLPDSATFSFTTALSLGCMLTDIAGSSWANLIVKPAGSGWVTPFRAYGLYITSGNVLEGAVSDGTRFCQPAGSTNMRTQGSGYVSLTWATTDGDLYNNGVSEGTDNDSGSCTSGSQPIAIGKRSTTSSGEFFQGRMKWGQIAGSKIPAGQNTQESNSFNDPASVIQYEAPLLPLTIVGTESANADNTTTFSVNVPSGTVDGDMLVLAVSSDGIVGIATPSGWDVREAAQASTGTHYNQLFTRTASSEPASYTLTFNGATSERAWGCMTLIQGRDGDPVYDSSNSNTGGADSTGVLSSITPAEDDSVVLVFLGLESGNAGNPVTTSWPSTVSTLNDNVNGPPGTGDGSAAGAVGEVVQTTAAAVSGNIGITGGASFWGVMGISINPAASTAQPSYFDGNDMITTQLITRQGIGYRTFRSLPGGTPPVTGRVMSSLAGSGGLAGKGGVAGKGGGLAG